jgi:hypothetical protein
MEIKLLLSNYSVLSLSIFMSMLLFRQIFNGSICRHAEVSECLPTSHPSFYFSAGFLPYLSAEDYP